MNAGGTTRKPKTAADVRTANLPQFMWGDPADAYERIEAGTCQGCGWVIRLRRQVIGRADDVIEGCSKGRPYGKRCKLYLETEAHG